jgi:hypothetical protein
LTCVRNAVRNFGASHEDVAYVQCVSHMAISKYFF